MFKQKRVRDNLQLSRSIIFVNEKVFIGMINMVKLIKQVDSKILKS